MINCNVCILSIVVCVLCATGVLAGMTRKEAKEAMRIHGLSESDLRHIMAVDEGERNEAITVIKAFRDTKDREGYLLKYAVSSNEAVLSWVAWKLRQFSTDKSIHALRQLKDHKQRNRYMTPVHVKARESLEYIESRADLEKLKGSRLADQSELIRFLALGSNEYARVQCYLFLLEHAEDRQGVVIPYLVELYPYERRSRQLITQPQNKPLVRDAIQRGLRSPNDDVIKGCIQLVGELGFQDLVPEIGHFMYGDRHSGVNAALRQATMAQLRKIGGGSIPFLEKVLASKNRLARFDAVVVLENIESSKSLEVLNKCLARERKRPKSKKDTELIEEVQNAMVRMERRENKAEQ